MKPAALLAVAVLFLAACATTPSKHVPRETFVVLPSAEGKVGSVVVKSGGKEQVLDEAYAASRVENDGQLAGGTVASADVHRTFSETLAALPGKPASFLLFFVEGKDELTPSSNAELKSVMAEIKRRPEPDVQVIGHTDAVGGESFNDKLSQARAEKIRDQLVTLGITRDRIQVSSRGMREPLVVTAAGVAEAKNRRVEVSVR
ncbi:MAG: OmpA family protein [Betaproteobacteria bacterium]|nr:OmpA family protein [Betaproteobacteria bacterium]